MTNPTPNNGTGKSLLRFLRRNGGSRCGGFRRSPINRLLRQKACPEVSGDFGLLPQLRAGMVGVRHSAFSFRHAAFSVWGALGFRQGQGGAALNEQWVMRRPPAVALMRCGAAHRLKVWEPLRRYCFRIRNPESGRQKTFSLRISRRPSGRCAQ